MNLKGHTALITGAGQGIGLACAEVMAQRGAALILLDKNQDALDRAAEKLKDKVRVETHALNLTDIELLTAEAQKISEKNRVDILVNNAGFDRPGSASKITAQDFSAVMGIHLLVPTMLIKAFLPGMREAGWGRIVNVSSIYGLIGGKGEIAYSTAKAGVIGLTKSVAREAGKYGITVNAVMPGLTRTPTIETFMAEKFKNQIIAETPLARIAEPVEVAKAIAFLASDDASYITSAAIPVSGGWGI